MSYMEHSAAFSPTDGIQELSFDELEEVNGSAIPIVAAYYAIGIVGTLYVAAHAGLAANHK